ncbi:uncharacterized protein TNIN_483861 [Trichonephila inaurata madagascariensis]|uniref:Endonuclease/exonuclease/phosphatase domain-containing protein n=1 Tax=Trichonephila inaurata madagascariensis TaxID=2747483 RepID=A0A8X6YFD9_9ARAC|nr:uncharacterized protein TNIN_483861 [Trichonephila inaurata madagascariensis]
MRTINKNRVLVQCVTKEDKDRFLTAIKEKTNTLQVSSPRKRNPNMLLKNLPNEISDHEVLQLLKDQNPELEEKVQLWEETKIRFTLKKFENSRHLVLEKNPTCRNLCLNMKFLRANWNVPIIRLVWSADANNKSEAWFSPLSDSRGTKLKNLKNLAIYIDIIAVGTDLLEDVSCWHLPYDSLSDHKAIDFDIVLNSNSSTIDGGSCIFNLKKKKKKTELETLYDTSKYLLSRISGPINFCQNPESLHELPYELISIQNLVKRPPQLKSKGCTEFLGGQQKLVA